MKKSNSSEGILVFDRYYTRKPNAFFLIIQRIAFCALLSVFSMLFVFSQFGLPVSLVFIGGMSALSTVLFLTAFTFLGRRYMIPAILLIAGLLVFFNFEEFWQRFSYFVDEAMLLVDGRFLFPKGYILHSMTELTLENSFYREGIHLGCFILCSCYSFLCAFSMTRRLRTMPALVGFLILCVPRLLAETFEFNFWFLPIAFLFAAAAAIELNYKNGLAVTRSSSSLYHSQVREEARAFNIATGKAPLLKRISMRASFYSKYATSGVLCIIIVAASFWIATSVFKEGSSIDYKELYDTFFVSEGQSDIRDGSTSEEVISNYFSSPYNESTDLNITAPGKGDQSIIKVSFTGENDIYLRGDIGIDFTGTGWTTPLTNTQAWSKSGISQSYRPAEIHIAKALTEALGVDEHSITAQSDIQIEYLLETDVVFLPSYTNDFSFYNNDNFDVYGDFIVRVSDDAGNYISTVQCTAVSHALTGDKDYNSGVIKMLEKLYKDNNISPDKLYPSVIDYATTAGNSDNVLESYSKFVNSTYLSVPPYLSSYLRDFLDDNNFEAPLDDSGHSRYEIAADISSFLSENYTYSLSGENQGEYALVHFLNESKSGHCSMYASSMTLLLRELGIPARYCTGFSIYPNKINGNTVELKERNLHAWVEVYIEELGWVTFDPTSAAVSENVIYNGPLGGDTTLPEEDTVDVPDLPETKDELPESEEYNHSDNGTSHTTPENEASEIPVDLILIVVSALILVSVVAALIWRYNYVKKTAEHIVSEADKLSIRDIYNCLVDIFYLYKLLPDKGALPKEYYVKCDKVFACGITENLETMEKAAFGGDGGTDEDKQIMSNILRTAYLNCCKRSLPLRKYKIRKIVSSLKTPK